MNIGGWLRNLGLERYEPLFIENAIDSDVLAELTEGDLEKLGIPLGDRKRLIKAIRTMLAGSPTTFTSGVGENAQSGQPRVAAAERRHLTVMICDLVGSTALSARLDPTRLPLADIGAVGAPAAATPIQNDLGLYPGPFDPGSVRLHGGKPTCS